MSIATLVLGESGSGKSTSLRNLDPEKTGIIQCINKPLPFKSSGWKVGLNVARTNDPVKILDILRAHNKDIIVIDDFQSVLVDEFMRRATQRGYDKFTDIGKIAWDTFNLAGALAEHRRVYILTHSHTDDNGGIHVKTVGKMVDQVITPEGYFTIVLRAVVNNGNYLFSTQTNEQDCCKSPMGMFSETLVDNDLKAIDDAICAYYGINNIHTIKEKIA
ncbi:putative phage protein [Candidatus Sodalis pierantonius str. SOPE]|uniref:Putative phage protein n=1 Tax=Candidatus Sodalis pierantonii str. SOPE TaxID=2342 RepID=W0HNS9_9GAMM|nr:ATP-binding protein [Candidatus Sodalis pierantonius]AHF73865.1 putative phage protein [Candidatus Sodalis pierantonius str. SOPE]